MIPARRRLPDTRDSLTRKIAIRHVDDAGKPTETDIYITVGLYEDRTPGEVFLKAGKQGAVVSGLLEALAVCISIGLQSGVPIRWYVDKLRGFRFEPAGPTADLGIVTSIVDAIAKWLDTKFPAEAT